MHYYRHHIGDFLRDTARLTDSQSMTYLRMLWIYYDTEQPLPLDPQAIAFQLGAKVKDVKQILKHYFFEQDNAYHHARCDAEIAAWQDRKKKAIASINARWNRIRT